MYHQDFVGEKDSYFCGVFDGHGPSGHKVARYVRDTLPSILSYSSSKQNRNGKYDKVDDESGALFSSSWKSTILKSYKDMDDDLYDKPTIDSFCSGTTSVVIIKQVNLLISVILYIAYVHGIFQLFFWLFIYENNYYWLLKILRVTI